MMKVGQTVFYIKNDMIFNGKLYWLPLPDNDGTAVVIKTENNTPLIIDYSDVFSKQNNADDVLRGRLKVEHNTLLERQQAIKQRLNAVKRALGWSTGD